jgi:hypothetical protein
MRQHCQSPVLIAVRRGPLSFPISIKCWREGTVDAGAPAPVTVLDFNGMPKCERDVLAVNGVCCRARCDSFAVGD